MEVSHKKNTASYIAIPMLNAATPSQFRTGLTVATLCYYRDEGGPWTEFTLEEAVVEIGVSGMYDLFVSASELNHDKVLIKLTAAGAADTAVMYNTMPKPAINEAVGDGSVYVNHDYGGNDALRIVDQFGVGLDNATVRVYTADDYAAENTAISFVVAETRTDVNGRWEDALMLDPGDYVIVVFKQKVAAPQIIELTVE